VGVGVSLGTTSVAVGGTGVRVTVGVYVDVGGTFVIVTVGVFVIVGVWVMVGVCVAVPVGVPVHVMNGVKVCVGVHEGVTVTVPTVGVSEGVAENNPVDMNSVAVGVADASGVSVGFFSGSRIREMPSTPNPTQ